MKEIIDLVGKRVKFLCKLDDEFVEDSGTVSDVILNINGFHQISIDGGEFNKLSDLLEFKILDSDPVADAFEALITDNKDFIDSLSKHTL